MSRAEGPITQLQIQTFMIKIYNTLTKQKEEFKPKKSGTVKMYACGVTVYDNCHIGHGRSLYIFEVIRRYLTFRGFAVSFVRNITDVDDKIIDKARQLSKTENISLKVAFDNIRRRYIESYYDDLKNLDIPPADIEPKATDNIARMQEHIKGLIEKGFAYEKDGNVYFSVRKFPEYGKLSGKKIDDLISSVRIEPDPLKKDPLDFSLWKSAKIDEPSWDSPWGRGRPGWHIECSAMSQEYLKTDTLDIHGGGRDLVFPHHENEISQSEALTSKQFSRYWMHHGLLTINGQKMAKSSGNFVTIKDVLTKYPSDVLKIFYLQAHYGRPIDFSWEKMEEAKRAYERIIILKNKLEAKYASVKVSEAIKAGAPDAGNFKQQFIDAMDDDFNSAKGLATLFEMVNRCHNIFDSDFTDKDTMLSYAMDIINEIAGVFCLTFFHDKPHTVSDDEISDKIAFRESLRSQKKYEEADKIRKKLDEQGIILEDTDKGTTWRRRI